MPPARRPTPVAALRAVVTASVCASALGACSVAAFARGAGQVVLPVPLAASGLEVPEQARRDALVAGRWDTTRVTSGPSDPAASAPAVVSIVPAPPAVDPDERGDSTVDDPGDALLRDLDRGTAAYYAGRWRASVAAFTRAATLADDRETKHVGRGALALATNDRALPYTPGQNERLFVHYYAALAYLRAGAVEDAAVEARRLSLLLQRYDERRDSLDVSARAALRYVAGAVFEAAGAENDAAVAYRNAAALGAVVGGAAATSGAAPAAVPNTKSDPLLDGTAVARTRATRRRTHGVRMAPLQPSTPPAVALVTPSPAPPTGDVVVVLERGFVTHRVGQRLRVWTSRRGESFASVDVLRDRAERTVHGDDALWADSLSPDVRLSGSADSTAGVALPVDAPPTTATAPALPPGRAIPAIEPAAAGGPVTSVRVGAGAVPGTGTGPGSGRTSGMPTILRRASDRPREHHHAADHDDDDGDRWRLFTLAWPAYRRPPALGPIGGVVVDAPADTMHGTGAPTALAPTAVAPPVNAPLVVPPLVRGDLSLAVAADFKRDRAARLARLVARAALRATLVHEADRSDRTLGDLTAALGAAIERADTRSWHLLPADVHVVRLHLAPGAHTLAVDRNGEMVPLGVVRVQPGTVQIVSARLWNPDHAAPDTRVATAGFAPTAP